MPPALTAQDLQQIDRALADVGECPCPRRYLAGRAAWRGEVRLIIEKGRLKFIQRVTSEEVGTVAARLAPATTFQPWRETKA